MDLTYIQQTGDTGTGDGGDQYRGLDRFGRIVDQRWIPTATPQSPTDRFQYSYDRDSNRLTRTNVVNNNFNEQYGYDNFNQLISFLRGTHSQGWPLDPLGNWTQFTNDGSTQTRGNNQQNQITSLNGVAVQWYDANGNTTTDERGTTYKVDAWNRLVLATAGAATAAYSYDALGRRVTENRGGTVTDLYYSAAWQVLEERTGASTTQYVWSPVYVDALIERDSGGQRLYVQQDANFNVTAIVDVTGAVQERYVYDPYGAATKLKADWTAQTTNLFNWIYLHQGGRLDSTTGLYNFRFRDYSPTLGRWMEQDPISYSSGDSNLYDYVSSAPTVGIDPSGLLPPGEGGDLNRPGSSPAASDALYIIPAWWNWLSPETRDRIEFSVCHLARSALNALIMEAGSPSGVSGGGAGPGRPGGPGPRPPGGPGPFRPAGPGPIQVTPTNPSSPPIVIDVAPPGPVRPPVNVGPIRPAPAAPAIPVDPAIPPGPGWEWRGPDAPGGPRGGWFNPDTGETLHPDLNHPAPVGPHWDWIDPQGRGWRIYPDGTIEPNPGRR